MQSSRVLVACANYGGGCRVEANEAVLGSFTSWTVAAARLYLLFLYPKNERSDLTRAQLRTLKMLVEDGYDG